MVSSLPVATTFTRSVSFLTTPTVLLQLPRRLQQPSSHLPFLSTSTSSTSPWASIVFDTWIFNEITDSSGLLDSDPSISFTRHWHPSHLSTSQISIGLRARLCIALSPV